MLTVYVWIPQTKTSLGHASMKVSPKNREFDRGIDISDTYISWWPQKPGPMSVAWVVPKGVAHTYLEDVSEEGKLPDWQVNIYTLDEMKIKSYWYDVKCDLDAHWQAEFKNCATIVGRALRKGGGPFYLGDNVIWTPREVRTYACLIAAEEKVCQ